LDQKHTETFNVKIRGLGLLI